MALRALLTRGLGAFNGVFIGSFFGVTVYVLLSGDGVTVGEFLLATFEVGTFAFAAAASGLMLSWVRVYPLAPIWAGILSGTVGGVLAHFVPDVLSLSIVALPGPESAVGGFAAAFVLSILLRVFHRT